MVVLRPFRIKRMLPVQFTLASDSMETTHPKTLNRRLWLKHDKCSERNTIQVVFAKITHDDSPSFWGVFSVEVCVNFICSFIQA